MQFLIGRPATEEEHIWLADSSAIWTHYSIDDDVPHALLVAGFLPKSVPPEQVHEELWMKRTTIPAWQ